MSGSWSTLSEPERRRRRRRFALDVAADALTAQEAPPEGVRPPRFDQIYAAARDPVAALTEPLAAALAADGRARTAFEALLRDGAVCWFPLAAAAATPAGLDAREESGFRIWLRPSSAGEDQVYVLIRDREERDVRPMAIIALPPTGPPVCAPLPEDIDGVYQLIEREDSPLVRAIRDPASKVALR